MVDALPLARIAVGTLGAMCATGSTADVMQSMLLQKLKRGTIGIVVEVAGDNDLGMRRQLADDTDNAPHDLEAVGTCGALTSIAAGGMDDEDMKGVAVLGLALDIQDVSCGAHVGKRLDVEVVIAQRAERQGLVE